MTKVQCKIFLSLRYLRIFNSYLFNSNVDEKEIKWNEMKMNYVYAYKHNVVSPVKQVSFVLIQIVHYFVQNWFIKMLQRL